MRRFLIVDSLRLLAALAVMLFHFTARDSSSWGVSPTDEFPHLSQVSAYGFLGVQLFFVVSGFVIFLSAEGRTVREFVAARIGRLFPAYWTAVLLTAVLRSVIAPDLVGEVTIKQVLVNLTMLQTAFGVEHIDGVYWTLWVELLFYVWIGLLLSQGLRETQVYGFMILWPLAGFVAE